MNSGQKICISVSIGLVALIIILLASMLRVTTVGTARYGLLVNTRYTQSVTEEPLAEGRYTTGSWHSMITYPADAINIERTVVCLTKNGVPVSVTASARMLIDPETLRETFFRYGQEDRYVEFIPVYVDRSIRGACSIFNATENFSGVRGALDAEFGARISDAVARNRLGVSVSVTQLLDVTLDSNFKAAVDRRLDAEARVDVEASKREALLAESRGKLRIAEQESATTLIQAQSEADAVMIQANSTALGIRKSFEALASEFRLAVRKFGPTHAKFWPYLVTRVQALRDSVGASTILVGDGQGTSTIMV